MKLKKIQAVPTVGGQQELRGVLLRQPADLVDLLLDLQALQVVELGLVALEGAVHVVLASVLRDALVLQRPAVGGEREEGTPMGIKDTRLTSL